MSAKLKVEPRKGGLVRFQVVERKAPGRNTQLPRRDSTPVSTDRIESKSKSKEVRQMARDPFSSSSGGAQLRGFVGRLGLFTPHEFVEKAVNGKFGAVDGIRTDVVFLDDGPEEALSAEEAELISGMLVLNGPVVNELKPKIGNSASPMHLGRVKAIENKKGGQNDVIVLDPPSDEDKTLAREYLAWSATPPVDPFA